LLLLALPLLNFSTGAPGIGELSESNPARRDAEAIDRAVGPGWEAPFVLVAATDEGPITTRRELTALTRWQRKIAAQPGVRAVIGPGRIVHRTAPLQTLATKVADEEGSVEELDQLGPGLRRAANAVGELRHGLDEGAAGSGLLIDGSNR